MKRTALNFIIDAAAFGGFILLTTTGVLMRYVLPPGSGRHSTIWGLDRHEWGDIHFWVSALFLSILALHLLLHWRWIANVVAGRQRERSGLRAGLGIVGLVAVVALAIAPLVTPVETTGSGKRAPSDRDAGHAEVPINGAMTLQEVETATGVPAGVIIEALNLPATVTAQDRLGRLKNLHGFTISDVRDVVGRYQDSSAGPEHDTR